VLREKKAVEKAKVTAAEAKKMVSKKKKDNDLDDLLNSGLTITKKKKRDNGVSMYDYQMHFCFLLRHRDVVVLNHYFYQA
jgi:hypothetical protein